MFNIEDKISKKERYLYLKEVHLIQVLRALDTIARDAKFKFLSDMNMEISTCSEFVDVAQWHIKFSLTNSQWHTFIAMMHDGGHKIQLGETGKYYLH